MEKIIIITLIIVILILVFLLLKDYIIKKRKKNTEYIKNHFSNVLNTMNEGIIVLNDSYDILYFNENAFKIFKANKEIKFNNLKNIISEELFLSIKNITKKTRFDINLTNKTYSLLVYKEEAHKKNDIATTIIIRDVTENRIIEQTKRDFFSNASHELKSPLTAIIGYCELVDLEYIEKKDIKDVVNRIYKQAKHMELLVKDMQTLSKLEAILKDENKEKVNLNLSLKEVIEQQDQFIKNKNLKLIYRGNDLYLKALSLDIKKLFKNLLENAIKYTKENGTIEILLYREKKEIIFSIKDTGIGIEEEHVKRIFERFYRVDKGRLDGGTGLGLAIVKHIVIKYEGIIDVYSKVSEGTKITIKFNEN